MAPDPAPGVAVPLHYRRSVLCVRPYVAPGESVWVLNREWWPLTASAVALYTQRVKWGERALCREPAR